VDCLFCGYRKDRIANVTETDPANDGKADERCEQQKAKADFLNYGLDALPLSEFQPTKLCSYSGLEETRMQVI